MADSRMTSPVKLCFLFLTLVIITTQHVDSALGHDAKEEEPLEELLGRIRFVLDKVEEKHVKKHEHADLAKKEPAEKDRSRTGADANKEDMEAMEKNEEPRGFVSGDVIGLLRRLVALLGGFIKNHQARDDNEKKLEHNDAEKYEVKPADMQTANEPAQADVEKSHTAVVDKKEIDSERTKPAKKNEQQTADVDKDVTRLAGLLRRFVKRLGKVEDNDKQKKLGRSDAQVEQDQLRELDKQLADAAKTDIDASR